MILRLHRARERGAAALEMALILPVLLLVLGGIIDIGRMFFVQIELGNGAREGARMAAIYAYPANGTPSIRPQVELAVNPASVGGTIDISTELMNGTASAGVGTTCP